MAPRARQVLSAVFEERAPVTQFRERIGHGLFREPVPALLEFADGARELVVHVHTRLQFEFVDRLGDEVVGAVEEREVAVDVVVGRGHDDHRQVAQPGVVALADLDQQLMAGQVRHLDVGEDQLNRCVALQQLPRPRRRLWRAGCDSCRRGSCLTSAAVVSESSTSRICGGAPGWVPGVDMGETVAIIMSLVF